MDNNNLFAAAANGYDRDQVNEYVQLLRDEYKKVYDYAKAVEGNNEKLKKLCRSLSDENNALKSAPAASPAAPAADTAALLISVEKLAKLADEMVKENAALRSKIANPGA